MRKTHSYLKGPAETRARADGDAQRLQQVLKEVKRKLAEATATRDSCDLLIRKFDRRLDPSQIAPIRATKGKYGKHGGLIGATGDIIRESWPEAVSSGVIAVALEGLLDLTFSSHKERYRWAHYSLGNALKDLMKRGLSSACTTPRRRSASTDVGGGSPRRQRSSPNCARQPRPRPPRSPSPSGVGGPASPGSLLPSSRNRRTLYLGDRPFMAVIGWRPLFGPLGLAGCGTGWISSTSLW